MFYLLAQSDVVPDHIVHVQGMSDGAYWAMAGVVVAVILPLVTLVFFAGKMTNKVNELIPKVEKAIAHGETCDTERALSHQTLENHEGRIETLEGT